ncbi:glycosyltransferase family 4 protein [Xylanimonas ulmi]|uniref:Glycosyltransferase involved in cell wall biosynthesis n=1 Tax=Xylanimonas ulmi TaxID=228973 RepID=A0A4Q7LXX6_9MICO|nr:glycosyltransferase family 4 protein [Xylanibacterium ulmi]RZS59955.1 glycosyltransferase involved in cell wall biosynthesis [Xylanibacterium ulmi]
MARRVMRLVRPGRAQVAAEAPRALVDMDRLPQMPRICDITAIAELPAYTPPAKVAKTALRITWLSPPIGPGGGGHINIVRFAKHLQSKGHSVSFAVYETNTVPQSPSQAHDILKHSYGIDAPVRRLEDLGSQDVIFASSWETAYGLRSLDVPAHKFYFIQDFEPYFFPRGSRSVLAEETYRFGFYGIAAGRWIESQVKPFGMPCDHYEFGADAELYRPRDLAALRKRRRVLFYARPFTERRGFELGVIALSIFAKRHPEYEIVTVGQDLRDYDLPFEHTDLGTLTLDELGPLYREATACLVISLTNASLLPLELAAAGCVTVIDSGANNHEILGDIDGIVYARAFPTELAEALCQVVERDDIDEHAREVSRSVHDRDWQASLEKVERIILREVTTGGTDDE